MEGNFFYQRFLGNWCTIAFRVDTKACFSPLRRRLEIALLVSWYCSGEDAIFFVTLDLADEIFTLDVRLICLFILRFIYMIYKVQPPCKEIGERSSDRGKYTCLVFFPSNNTFSHEAIFHQKMRKLIVTLLR